MVVGPTPLVAAITHACHRPPAVYKPMTEAKAKAVSQLHQTTRPRYLRTANGKKILMLWFQTVSRGANNPLALGVCLSAY